MPSLTKKSTAAVRVIAGLIAGGALAFWVRGCEAGKREALRAPVSARTREQPLVPLPSLSSTVATTAEEPTAVTSGGGQSGEPSPTQDASAREDAEIIGPLTKELTSDYASFIARFNLSERTVEVFIETLVGQFFSQSDAEREEYERLLETLLGAEAYEAYQGYRDRIPREKRANLAVTQLRDAFPSISTEVADGVQDALTAVSPSTSGFDELRLREGPISDQEIEDVKKQYVDAFTRSLNDLEPHVGKPQIDFLKAWFSQSPELQSKVALLKKLQRTRVTAPKN